MERSRCRLWVREGSHSRSLVLAPKDEDALFALKFSKSDMTNRQGDRSNSRPSTPSAAFDRGYDIRSHSPAPPQPGGASTSSLTAEFLKKSTLELESSYNILVDVSYGCIGLVSIAGDVFLGIISGADSVGDIFGKSVFKVTGVSFFSLTTQRYDFHNVKLQGNGKSDDDNTPVQHPCQDLIKYLSSGVFFFSPVLDLTRSTQRRLSELSSETFTQSPARATSSAPGTSNSPLTSIYSLERVDEYFFWNAYLMRELLSFRGKLFEEERTILDQEGILVALIQGFVGVTTTYIPDVAKHYKVALISRLSAKRAGTRFSTRGLDDDGYTANFVETELIVQEGSRTFAYQILRGSVPIFWEQPGIQALVTRIEVSREFEATQPAFRNHFEALIARYDALDIVNLLSQKDKDQGAQGGSEGQLAYWYRTHVEKSLGAKLRSHVEMIDFDFHAKVKLAGLSAVDRFAEDLVSKTIKGFGYLEVEDPRNIIMQQTGHFRVNCLDCLDRTSVMQEKIARYVFEHFVETTGVQFFEKPSTRYSPDDPYEAPGIFRDEQFAQDWNNLWADNADFLSRIYAGTGALKSSATRHGKQTWAGLLDDAIKSGTRLVVNNLLDKSRQETINLLLGKSEQSTNLLLHDPVHEEVNAEVQRRLAEYSVEGTAMIQVGTWNLNGIAPYEVETPPGLAPWIQSSNNLNEPVDIIAIAFQEIVELNAQQIVSTDPAQRAAWEEKLKASINETKKEDYVLLRSVQLVGASLSLFVRGSIVDRVRRVETGIMKTGLRGLAGNKGGVAIRLDYYDTSICIVTAHLAAGHSNVEDRHTDYLTIKEGLRFRNGKRIDDHSLVIWAGDFNYRIDMENEDVRQLITVGDLQRLRVNDQLLRAMSEKRIFQGYSEGQLDFKPTYKYNNGTDIYDTSEKNRIPAWCDRILYKPRERLELLDYDTAQLWASDHRPVKALFRAKVTIVDRKKLREIEQNARSQSKGNGRTLGAREFTEGQLIDLVAPLPKPSPGPEMSVITSRALPPPSSDNSKWWEVPINKQQAAIGEFSIRVPPNAIPFVALAAQNSAPTPLFVTYVSKPVTIIPSALASTEPAIKPSLPVSSRPDDMVPLSGPNQPSNGQAGRIEAPSQVSRAVPAQWATFDDGPVSPPSTAAPASAFPSVTAGAQLNPAFVSPQQVGFPPANAGNFQNFPAAFAPFPQPLTQQLPPTAQFGPSASNVSAPFSSQFRPVLVQVPVVPQTPLSAPLIPAPTQKSFPPPTHDNSGSLI